MGIGDEAQKKGVRSGLEKQSLLFGGGMTWRFWFTWLRTLRWGEETEKLTSGQSRERF